MEENNPSVQNQAPNPSQAPDKKKYIYIAIAAVLILLVGYTVSRNLSSDEGDLAEVVPEEILDNTSSTVSASATTSAAEKAVPIVSTKKPSVPLSATQKYLDALKIYKNTGYYFQFVECHGLPGTLTMKKGKKFMLDNRDAKTRKIAISGGQSFKITAYNFAIATAPSKAGTYYITCDGGGAAKIVVQP